MVQLLHTLRVNSVLFLVSLLSIEFSALKLHILFIIYAIVVVGTHLSQVTMVKHPCYELTLKGVTSPKG